MRVWDMGRRGAWSGMWGHMLGDVGLGDKNMAWGQNHFLH